jgi:hypothetical protein
MKKLSLPIITAGLLIWAQSASAGPVGKVGVMVFDVVNNISSSCFDGDACDLSGTAGVVLMAGAVGDWTINITTGIGYPSAGSPNNVNVDLNSVNATSAVGGTVKVLLTQPDYVDAGTHLYKTDIGGTTDGSLTFKTFMDDLNDHISQGGFINFTDACSDLVSTIGPLGSGAIAGSATGAFTSGRAGCAAGYSVTLEATIVHDALPGEALQLTSFDAEVTQTPEPSTMILLGFGMAALGWRSRRKQS